MVRSLDLTFIAWSINSESIAAGWETCDPEINDLSDEVFLNDAFPPVNAPRPVTQSRSGEIFSGTAAERMCAAEYLPTNSIGGPKGILRND
ncbi:hypothetical protein KIN20_011237 [Parelaphostrongylus tenuis]|uniref:Uncharacterized protein n=1 Tax=Parelaphostrongylus tenuis TaxID=148309 RepID=A0AAD5MV45_PARTN|nr:hypothetical protein KIN20_011237 [Parelaphostrongylus tenuis]